MKYTKEEPNQVERKIRVGNFIFYPPSTYVRRVYSTAVD